VDQFEVGTEVLVEEGDVFDMLLGAVLTRMLLFSTTARARPVERTVEMVLRLLRPLG
jgi:hypothetical protein